MLTGCPPDDSGPDPLITEINAFDVGNDQTANDIRITFKLEYIASVKEFRAMIIPSKLTFDKRDALQLSDKSYHAFAPIIGIPEYSIRLSSFELDVEGTTIVNSKGYVVAILIDGNGFNQLSSVSNNFILKDQGIYNGTYEGELQSPLLPSIDQITMTIKKSLDTYKGTKWGSISRKPC